MRAWTLCLVLLASGAAAQAPMDGVPSSAKIELLPIDAVYKVTDAEGNVKYMSADQRFVFVGKMYDLWQGEAMTANVGVSRKINLKRNGVSLEKISFPIGDNIGDRTLFIAPECEDCSGLLELALKTKADNLNVVLLAASEAGHRNNAMVWCARNREQALRKVYLEKEQPGADELNDECDQFGLMLAEQAAMVFGIGQLPLYVDEKGVGHVGESAIYAVSN